MSLRTRAVAAGAFGNVIEWYDFGLYGLLAPLLAARFFPARDPVAALLGVYGGFALGFAVRPLGAIVLGRIGDRHGRRFVLVLSVVLMGAATMALGLLPTYAAVGVWAPILLILVRLFQGFSVGGEFVGSVTYLVETAAPDGRGLAGSVANIGATIGMLLAAAAATLAQSAATTGRWRGMFLLGGVLALAGYWLRRSLPAESAAHTLATSTAPAWPAIQAIREMPRRIFLTLLFAIGYGISNYLIMVFLPAFAQEFAAIAGATALRINTLGQALILLLLPLAGWLSDHWLRRRTLLAAAFLLQAALGWELFRAVLAGGSGGLWAAQLVLAGLLALVMGAAPAMLAEQFPRAYRMSAHALVLNLGIGLGGGLAPLAAVALIRATGDNMAPAVFLALGCLLAAAAVLVLPDRSRQPLPSAAAAATEPPTVNPKL